MAERKTSKSFSERNKERMEKSKRNYRTKMAKLQRKVRGEDTDTRSTWGVAFPDRATRPKRKTAGTKYNSKTSSVRKVAGGSRADNADTSNPTRKATRKPAASTTSRTKQSTTKATTKAAPKRSTSEQRKNVTTAKKTDSGATKSKGTSSFGSAFRSARNAYLSGKSNARTFEHNGKKYHIRIKGESQADLQNKRKGAPSKAPPARKKKK